MNKVLQAFCLSCYCRAKRTCSQIIHLIWALGLLVSVFSCKNATTAKVTKPVFSDSLSYTDTIQNPILPGFNPDPCIIRVEDDYYIVTSTFEWFPGVPVYHSRDLVHWHQIGHILTSEKVLNLRGVGNSSGIFAPSLHYVNGRFYLLYTVVTGQFPFLAAPNYIISADNINGPWSEPVYLNSTGFDPALFADDDGRCYLLNMTLDFYHEVATGGISMQELDLQSMKLKGSARNIFKGTCFGTEGPRIYKRNGIYYLFTAEGGTDWGHRVTVARAASIHGPYEVDPRGPMISSKDDSLLAIQRAGHASLVETQNGKWYIAYLGSRPVMPARKSILGRESFLQPVEWTADNWIRLASGGHTPQLRVASPKLPDYVFPPVPGTDSFTTGPIRLKYQSLRQAFSPDWISLMKKPGYLAMRGRKPFSNLDDQSMLMQRITSLYGTAETCIEFNPTSYRHMAGLMCFYDTRDFVFLKLSYDEKHGKYIGISYQEGAGSNTEAGSKTAIPNGVPVYLKVDFSYDSLWFSYALKRGEWNRIGPAFDFTKLSDENNKYGFTGSMVGLAVYDHVYESEWAYFDYFRYDPR